MSKGLTARVGRTELQPEGSDLVFIHPYHGSGTYAQIMGEIDAAGLKRPTFNDTVTLAHAAWQNPEEKYSKEIIGLMKSDWLVTDTSLLYLPNEGVYIQDHPQTNENGWVTMDKEDLASRVKDGDPNVRFVKCGYSVDGMSLKQLAKSIFVKGLTGSKEGAQMVADIADKYSDKPYVYAFNASEVSEPITRVAALYSGWYAGRLDVFGYFPESYSSGYAFGVAPKSEARAQK